MFRKSMPCLQLSPSWSLTHGRIDLAEQIKLKRYRNDNKKEVRYKQRDTKSSTKCPMEQVEIEHRQHQRDEQENGSVS